jgi:hypothetical protein
MKIDFQEVEWEGMVWIDLALVRDRHLSCGNEPSGSIKCGEFLDLLKTSLFLKQNSSPWSE